MQRIIYRWNVSFMCHRVSSTKRRMQIYIYIVRFLFLITPSARDAWKQTVKHIDVSKHTAAWKEENKLRRIQALTMYDELPIHTRYERSNKYTNVSTSFSCKLSQLFWVDALLLISSSLLLQRKSATATPQDKTHTMRLETRIVWHGLASKV